MLDTFIPALLMYHHPRSGKVLQLIDQQYEIDFNSKSLYDNIMSVIDFIAGMTDTYAVALYRKIKGIDIHQVQ